MALGVLIVAVLAGTGDGASVAAAGSYLHAPTLTRTDPVSPTNRQTVRVYGRSRAGSVVDVYVGHLCDQPPVTVSAAEFAESGAEVQLPVDSETWISARARDRLTGEKSICDTLIYYRQDSTAPSIYRVVGWPERANDNTPTIRVGAEDRSASKIAIYKTNDCSGQPVAKGDPETWIELTVPDDSTTRFRAIATDAAGNSSACSRDSYTYVEDSTGPAPPVLTQPASPGGGFGFMLGGTRSTDTERVDVYAGASCDGGRVAAGDKFDLDLTRIYVAVPEGETRTFSARTLDSSGNASRCSNSVSYRAMHVPRSLTSRPAAAGQTQTPMIRGELGSGARVLLFDDEYCYGQPIGSGTAASFRQGGIAASVDPQSTTTIFAQAESAGGARSMCSARPGLTYRHDTVAPDTDIYDLGPIARPEVELSSSEPGSRFRCQIDRAPWTNCPEVVEVPMNGRRRTVRARAVDTARNRDATAAMLILRP